MNEERTPYNTGESLPMTLEAFRNRSCALHFNDPKYTSPEPEEVAQLIRLAGWSQTQVANLVGVKSDPKRGSSTIRKWKSHKAKDDHRPIPYSAWRLMLLHAGVVAIDLKV